MLLNAKEKQHPVFVWRIIGDKKILAQVKLDLILSARGEIRISPNEESLIAFNHVVGGCRHINLFFPNSSTLFQAEVKSGYGEYGLIIGLPPFIAQMERRKWLRMFGELHPKLRIQFSKKVTFPHPMNQFFSKALIDLSAGGSSFLATRAELRFLIEGEELKNLELLIDGRKMKVDAKVLRVQELSRHSYPPSMAKTYKVSFSFSRIDKKDQEQLAKYIFQNLKSSSEAV